MTTGARVVLLTPRLMATLDVLRSGTVDTVRLAAALGVTPGTAKERIRALLRAFGVHSRAALLARVVSCTIEVCPPPASDHRTLVRRRPLDDMTPDAAAPAAPSSSTGLTLRRCMVPGLAVERSESRRTKAKDVFQCSFVRSRLSAPSGVNRTSPPDPSCSQ